jgi:hypothetical protein
LVEFIEVSSGNGGAKLPKRELSKAPEAPCISRDLKRLEKKNLMREAAQLVAQEIFQNFHLITDMGTLH